MAVVLIEAFMKCNETRKFIDPYPEVKGPFMRLANGEGGRKPNKHRGSPEGEGWESRHAPRLSMCKRPMIKVGEGGMTNDHFYHRKGSPEGAQD